MNQDKIYLEYLPNQLGGKHVDVLKFKTHCEDKKNVIGWIQATKTLQTSYKYNKRGHVAIAVINEYPDTNFIVKIQTAGHRLTNNEINILKELQQSHYIVRYICDFVCADKELKWKRKINKPTMVCGEGNTLFHVLITEYIDNGSLYDYVQDNAISPGEFSSIIRQLYLNIIDMSVNHHIFHGDINGGNILLDITNKPHISYSIQGKKLRVPTAGMLPVFTDFENGIRIEKNKKIDCNDVIDDIVQMLELFHHRVDSSRMILIRKLISRLMVYYDKENVDVLSIVDVIVNFKFV